MSIDNVQSTRHCPKNHAHDFQSEEEVRPKPAIPRDVRCGDSKTKETCAAENELRDYQQEPEFGLVDAPILDRQDPGAPIRKKPAEGEPEERTDKGPHVHVSRLHFSEPERWTEEYGGEHDTYHDSPADECTLNQGRPKNGRVEEQGDGSEKELPKRLVSLAAVEGKQRAKVWCLARDCMYRLLAIDRVAVARASLGFCLGRAVRQAGLMPGDVGIESLVPPEGCFWAVEDDERQESATKDGNQVECPLPADRVCDLSDQDRCEECAAEKGEVAQSHAFPSFLDSH